MRDVLSVAQKALGPLLVVGSDRTIRYCSAGAADLLGVPSEEARGRSCASVLEGEDAFGNRYCSSNCPVFGMIEQGRAPRPFELHRPNGQRVRMQPLAIDGEERAVIYQLQSAEPSRAAQAEPSPSLAKLSAREREVLEQLMEGAETETIALRLGITRTTVRNHVQRILRKLGVHSKLEAVAVANGHRG